MSVLISAPIRTGKTLLVVQKIFEELNKGRMVYTNIVGMNIDGVIRVSSGINQPFDWRDLPNGSVLVWDEAHEHPAFSSDDLLKNYKIDETDFNQRIDNINNSNKLGITEKKLRVASIEREKKDALAKAKDDILEIGRSLLLHGHFGIEIYFLTQRVDKLNKDVQASVVNHYILRRKFGFKMATIWEFGEAITGWSKSISEMALNKTHWRYPEHLYKFYTSSENHQVRKTFPKKYFAFLLLPIALFGYALHGSLKTGFFGLFGQPKQEQVQQTQPNVTHYSVDQAHGMSASQLLTEKLVKECMDKGGTEPQCREQNDEAYRNAHMNVSSSNTTDQQLTSLSDKCRHGEYVDTPECKQWFNDMSNQHASMTSNGVVTTNVSYNPSKPYDQDKIQEQVNSTYQVVNKPKFAGCMIKNGRYVGYTEQGTIMKDVSQSDCKRLIIENDRPYDYFSDRHAVTVQQQAPVQQEPQQTQQPIKRTGTFHGDDNVFVQHEGMATAGG